MSIGNIKDYTPNYKFIIPKFDTATWHDYIESNFRSIDALLYNIFVVNGYKGEWTNSTLYEVGSVIFIGDNNGEFTGKLFKVLVEHTTPNDGNFETFYANNPDKYEQFADFDAAERAAQLAKDWANKLGGTVDGLEYSAKYYAELAQQTVNNKANDNEVVHLTGTEIITGPKTFSSTISGNIDGNAATVTNGVYTTGDQTITGYKTFTSKITTGSIELFPMPNSTKPYIDFHYNSSSSDYTSRIIENTSGAIDIETNPMTVTGEIFRKNKNIIKGTAPSQFAVTSYGFLDNNRNVMGLAYHGYNTSKDSSLRLQVYKANSASDTEADYASLGVIYPASGNPYGFCPHSDTNGSILTTYNKSKASNGYFQLGNGLIIQWGNTGTGNKMTTHTITFPKAFSSSTSYSLSASGYMITSGIGGYNTGITSRTSTNFVYHGCNEQSSAENNCFWVAIGY